MENQNFNPLDTFDHVVVLMLENRSFDNLLGHLYDGDLPPGASFAGLSKNAPLSNPTASFWTDFGVNSSDLSSVQVAKAKDYHQPFPDPGEEFQHVNTQLFNQIDSQNRGKGSEEMSAPFNLPSPTPNPAGMQGFVNDYINTLLGMPEKFGAKKFQPPSREQFEVIMQCFMPDQVPVLSTLAKEFAVFDHWYCSVPSQTWCNRAFWHTGTSGGFVNNPSVGGVIAVPKMFNEWKRRIYDKPNLFSRMHDKGDQLSTKIYASQYPSLTKLINGNSVGEIVTPIVGQITRNNLNLFKQDIENGDKQNY